MPKPSEHKWSYPPPGQGGGQTCKVCGMRRSYATMLEEAGHDASCKGVNRSVATKHKSDYEPFE